MTIRRSLGKCLSGGAAASFLSCDCTLDASAVPRESEYVDKTDVDAGIGMDFTGEANMSAIIIGEDQYYDFEEEVVIEEWVFFDEGEEDNSCDAVGLVYERTGSQRLEWFGSQRSSIGCLECDMHLSVSETTREIWCQNATMQRAISILDSGKDEFSSCWSNYGLGIVCLADTSIGEKQPVVPRSLTESKCVWQRAIRLGDEPRIIPSVSDPPWVEAWGALESLVAMSPVSMVECNNAGKFRGTTSASDW